MSKKKISTDPSKVLEIDEGVAWIRHPLDLLVSDAWRTRSIHCRKLIDRLEVEHLRHRGLENGRLSVSFNQFCEEGIGRRFIAGAIREGEARGLLRAIRGGKKAFNETYVTRYRLTYLKSVFIGEDGLTCYHSPTNEWRRFRSPPKQKNSSQGHQREPSRDTKVNSKGAPSCTAHVGGTAEKEELPRVNEGDPPIISTREDDRTNEAPQARARARAEANSRPQRDGFSTRHVDSRQIDLEDFLAEWKDKSA